MPNRIFSIRNILVLLTMGLMGAIAQDVHAQNAAGWRGDVRPRFRPRILIRPTPGFFSQPATTGAIEQVPVQKSTASYSHRRYDPRIHRDADAYSRYPKYIGGFHSSHYSNLGVPTGDRGFRGNGIYWAPW